MSSNRGRQGPRGRLSDHPNRRLGSGATERIRRLAIVRGRPAERIRRLAIVRGRPAERIRRLVIVRGRPAERIRRLASARPLARLGSGEQSPPARRKPAPIDVPGVAALRHAGRGAIRAGERALTPARAVATVILGAAILLAASQFVDYRGVGIGAPLYERVEAIASAPLADRERAGSAHSYVMLPIAALAVAALVFAMRGRWQLGRAVALLGAIGIAVSLLIDMPKGLDEGLAARNFEGAEARLLEGFWIQLSSSAVLLVAGVLLSRYARLERPPAARRQSRRVGAGRRSRTPPAQGARA